LLKLNSKKSEVKMLEIIGLIFGGVSRLGQHWLELKDKDKERSHEAVMYTKQIELADKRAVHDQELRRMDSESAESKAEWEAMIAAINAQAEEAKSAGGWVAKLSASVRPMVTYWLLLVYSMAKLATLVLAVRAGEAFPSAVAALYTEADGALLASILSFWFVDRSLRKRGV
jgi:hypothetical protein